LPQLISSASDLAAVAPLVARSDQKAAGAWTAEDVSLDLRAQLDRISVPLLEVAPGSAMAKYYKPLSGDSSAQVAAVENSRHFIMFDEPQALDALIAHFLVRIGG
jgi:pimeloyl-ACP methyl ester carboxylesterase